MIDVEIGAVVDFGDFYCKCVKGGDCPACCLDAKENALYCDAMVCGSYHRKDENTVIFVLCDEEGNEVVSESKESAPAIKPNSKDEIIRQQMALIESLYSASQGFLSAFDLDSYGIIIQDLKEWYKEITER